MIDVPCTICWVQVGPHESNRIERRVQRIRQVLTVATPRVRKPRGKQILTVLTGIVTFAAARPKRATAVAGTNLTSARVSDGATPKITSNISYCCGGIRHLEQKIQGTAGNTKHFALCTAALQSRLHVLGRRRGIALTLRQPQSRYATHMWTRHGCPRKLHVLITIHTRRLA